MPPIESIHPNARETAMPPFEDPGIQLLVDPVCEVRSLTRWRDTRPKRSIPQREKNHLLVATWNIANLGDLAQKRTPEDLVILAALVSWFDLVAIQEVKRDLGDLQGLMANLPKSWRAVFTDIAGNRERMVFLYDAGVVERRELAGEVAVAPGDHRHIKIKGIKRKFRGFDRNPYAVAFRKGNFEFTLANAHLYYGSDSTSDKNRRVLEAYALGRWADLEQKSGAYDRNIIVLGDLNIPKAQLGDPIYDALTKRGLQVPPHSSRIGSAIASDNHYDQVAFFPGNVGDRRTDTRVFDFDGAVFGGYWTRLSKRYSRNEALKRFRAYVRYHLSDHRLLWSRFCNR